MREPRGISPQNLLQGGVATHTLMLLPWNHPWDVQGLQRMDLVSFPKHQEARQETAFFICF